ncbi:hypothetical protein GH714_038558 [Hevea brasiliensis]|uniref:FCP1 homology domain-containing protein n=1 Tax=Hevea brasiliensis TaxID=3981 RepID=A0A6A6KP24_HEVBR|nr:hypothetical protein GH714_038558 [Hevea brasiliensis]
MAGNFGRKLEEDGGHLKGNLLEKPILTTPRKKLLVLSLGGLLCHRVCRRYPSSVPKYRIADAAYGSILGQCNKSEFNNIEKKDKPIFLKELNKLWENELWKGRYTSVNTLLIDDEPYKALLNPPHTAIFPTEYKANHVNDTASGPEGRAQAPPGWSGKDI